MKLLTLVVLAGCASEGATFPDAPGADAGSVALVLGTTATDGSGFFPLAGDQTLVSGSQGGFHVWLKVRVGHAGGALTLHRTARRVADDRLILDTQGAVLVEAGDGGTWEMPSAIPSFMCPTPIGVAVRDQAIRLVATLLDEGGATLATASAEFTPHCPDGAELQHCLDICSG
jgi:hypothetical protein